MRDTSRTWFHRLAVAKTEPAEPISLADLDLTDLARRSAAGGALADLPNVPEGLEQLWRTLIAGRSGQDEAARLADRVWSAGVAAKPLVAANFRLVENCVEEAAERFRPGSSILTAATVIAGMASTALLDAFASRVDRIPQDVVSLPVSAPVNAAEMAEATASSIIDMARQTSQDAGAASGSAALAAMNVRMVSGMMGEIVHGMVEVKERVVKSQQRATAAMAEARKTNERISQLEDTVGQISSVAKLIKAIAHRTNLLAMNATIEAARAGDAGRGFAVVAGEVKSLANQTSKATEEIDSRLATIRDATSEVVHMVSSVTDGFVSIHDLVDGIAESVRDEDGSFDTIKACTEDAASSVDGIAQTLDRIAAIANSTVERMGGLIDTLR